MWMFFIFLSAMKVQTRPDILRHIFRDNIRRQFVKNGTHRLSETKSLENIFLLCLKEQCVSVFCFEFQSLLQLTLFPSRRQVAKCRRVNWSVMICPTFWASFLTCCHVLWKTSKKPFWVPNEEIIFDPLSIELQPERQFYPRCRIGQKSSRLNRSMIDRSS